MKRRSFIGGLLGVAPVAAVAAISTTDTSERTLKFTLHCGKCEIDYPESIPLDRLISKGTPQCPKCLMVLPYPNDLAERIFSAQGRDKYGQSLK